jgi:DNA modification methylase
MGNCAGLDEFMRQFRFMAEELYRITMPGRLVSMHCMDLPRTKERDGVIALSDFPSVIRQCLEDVGFYYHSKVCIWKDPVTAMQRTKAIGLLHKQIKKDSARSRQGIADYVVTVYKPGENPVPICHDDEEFPVSMWQRYASPVWMDIDQSRVLPYRGARSEKDERHICPLQLGVIERLIFLWSARGDLVFDPFTGVGSTGHEALRMGRRFIGTELKESYFKQAVKNLRTAEEVKAGQASLGLELE